MAERKEPSGYELSRRDGAWWARHGSTNITELRQFLEVHGCQADIEDRLAQLEGGVQAIGENPNVSQKEYRGTISSLTPTRDRLLSLLGDAAEVERWLKDQGWEWDRKRKELKRISEGAGAKRREMSGRVVETFQQIHRERGLPTGRGNHQEVRAEIRRRLSGEFSWDDLDPAPRKTMAKVIDNFLNPP